MRKIAIFKLLITAAVLIAATLGLAHQDTTQTMTEKLLNRQVVMFTGKSDTSSSSFKLALNRAKAPGGIVAVPSCDPPPRYKPTPSSASLRDALEAIVVADPECKWEVENGVINIVPSNSFPEFLNIRIAQFKVQNAATVYEALDRLLSMPELRHSDTQFNSSSRVFRGGLGYFEPPKRDKNGNIQGLTVVCENVTVREALNAIARAHGSAIWAYTEHRCGTDAFSLDFLVQ